MAPPSWQPTEPPTPDWATSQYLVDNEFEKLAARRAELKELKDQIEAEISELDPQIGAMLATADLKSVRFGYHRFTLGYGTAGGRLSKERLLENGVTAEQIQKATTPKTVGSAYVRVTSIDAPED